MTDLEAIVRRAQARDLAAFTELVKRFQAMAIGYAYSTLGDFGQAEEVAQESFVRAFLDLGKLQEPAAFPGWFRTVVFRHCCRVTRRKQIPTVPLDEAAHVPGPDAAAEIEKREVREFVRQAIAALPEKEREATTLFYINGYSMAEVGEFLEVPVSTVKNRLHSARKKLHERTLHMVEDTLKANVPEPDEMAERVVFFSELGRLIDQGIPLLRALNEISERLRSEKMRTTIDEVKECIKDNSTFSAAIARFPEIFPAKVVSLIRDGEVCGMLEVFTPYARDYLETGQFRMDPYAFINCQNDWRIFGRAMDLGAEAVLVRPDILEDDPWKNRYWSGKQVVALEFLMPDGTTRKYGQNLADYVRDLKFRTVFDECQDETMRGMLRTRLRPDDKHEALLPIVFYPGRDVDEVRVDLKPMSFE